MEACPKKGCSGCRVQSAVVVAQSLGFESSALALCGADGTGPFVSEERKGGMLTVCCGHILALCCAGRGSSRPRHSRRAAAAAGGAGAPGQRPQLHRDALCSLLMCPRPLRAAHGAAAGASGAARDTAAPGRVCVGCLTRLADDDGHTTKHASAHHLVTPCIHSSALVFLAVSLSFVEVS